MTQSIHIFADQFFSTTDKIRRLIGQCCDIPLDEKMATLLQLQALSYLNSHPQATVGELAHELGMSSSAVAQFTDRLVNTNRIIRQNDPKDRRITRLILTAEGQQQLLRLKKHAVDKISQILSYISEKDLQELIRIQTKLLKKLEADNQKNENHH